MKTNNRKEQAMLTPAELKDKIIVKTPRNIQRGYSDDESARGAYAQGVDLVQKHVRQ